MKIKTDTEDRNRKQVTFGDTYSVMMRSATRWAKERCVPVNFSHYVRHLVMADERGQVTGISKD